MGFRILYIQIADKSPERIHSELLLRAMGEFQEVSDSPISGMVAADGSYLINVNDGVPDETVLANLSRKASVLVNYVNETVGVNFASAWQDGRELWSVLHEENSIEVEGSPPSVFETIFVKLQHQQDTEADRDYVSYIFDIPTELFVALGGERYDKISDIGSRSWQVLESEEEIGPCQEEPVSLPPPPTQSRSTPTEREFYELLGDENLGKPCKRENCDRGSIGVAHLCKVHHFEAVTGKPCPYAD